MKYKDTPVFILSKDRRSCLETLLARLAQDGMHNIFIVDTGSTYPPMLEFLAETKLPIIRVEPKTEHAPKFVLWDRGVIAKANQENKHFVYTDCDIVPDGDCPNNWIEHLFKLLSKHKSFQKAGLGLRLNDIPDCYAHKAKVIAHEHRFWTKALSDHVFDSELDTTLALHRPGTPHTYRAIRTGGKYICRHLPWYYDTANLPEEERYYIANLHPKASFWTRRDRKNITNDTSIDAALQSSAGTTQSEPGPSTGDVPPHYTGPSAGNDPANQCG